MVVLHTYSLGHAAKSLAKRVDIRRGIAESDTHASMTESDEMLIRSIPDLHYMPIPTQTMRKACTDALETLGESANTKAVACCVLMSLIGGMTMTDAVESVDIDIVESDRRNDLTNMFKAFVRARSLTGITPRAWARGFFCYGDRDSLLAEDPEAVIEESESLILRD